MSINFCETNQLVNKLFEKKQINLLKNVKVMLHALINWIEVFVIGLEHSWIEYISQKGQECILEHHRSTNYNKS